MKNALIIFFAFTTLAAAKPLETRLSFYEPSENSIPQRFSSTAETESIQWGCPVQDEVRARTSAEAVELISAQCRREVEAAAAVKPNVMEVLQTSVIWPDITISENRDGYVLKGTFFLETVVLKGMAR